eukprot:1708916-Amphidinium_carterae.1
MVPLLAFGCVCYSQRSYTTGSKTGLCYHVRDVLLVHTMFRDFPFSSNESSCGASNSCATQESC